MGAAAIYNNTFFSLLNKPPPPTTFQLDLVKAGVHRDTPLKLAPFMHLRVEDCGTDLMEDNTRGPWSALYELSSVQGFFYERTRKSKKRAIFSHNGDCLILTQMFLIVFL